MSQFKNPVYLVLSTGPEFDAIHAPGDQTPHSGIYWCQGCGREIASVKGHPLPPQNHHQHGGTGGTIRWKLIVKTAHD